jgi:hypothetical protein
LEASKKGFYKSRSGSSRNGFFMPEPAGVIDFLDEYQVFSVFIE